MAAAIELLRAKRVDEPNVLAVGGLVLLVAEHAQQRVLALVGTDVRAELSRGAARSRRRWRVPGISRSSCESVAGGSESPSSDAPGL